jgi:hypothetical protein
MDKLMQYWTTKKPMILGLLAGMLLGPLISGTMGWQVSSAFLQRSVHAAEVKQQVAFCEMRARAAVKEPGKLEYSDRYDLAKVWAKMPGQEAVDSDVVSGCTNGLAG